MVSGYERESNRDPNSDIRSVRQTTAKGILAKLEQIASALPTQPQPSDLEQAAVIWADAILEQRADMCPADRALVNAVGSFVLHTRTDDVALPTALTEAESELTRHKRLCNHCVSDYDLCVVGEEIHLRTMESAAALAAPLPTVSTDVRDRIKHVVEDVVTRFASVFSEYYAATPIMTATLVNEITAALVAAFAGEGEKSQVPTGGMSVLLGYEAGFKEGMEAAKIAKDETERLAEVADGTLDHRHEGAQIVHDAIKEAVK